MTFQAAGITIYGTFRHLKDTSKRLPAALLIAGSGPTDRNGDSGSLNIGTLRALAGWLSDDGVTSLRYDKLASGRTGLGSYASAPETVGVEVFEQEAAAALTFLAGRQGVDPDRLAVIGHSEGALFALLTATGGVKGAPPVHALGLLEPLSVRFLDVVSDQVSARVAAQLKSGQITEAQAAQVQSTLAAAISSLRTSGTVAANLPFGLSALLSPARARYLMEVDRFDPGQLAASLPAQTPVLVSCSNADIQVTCAEVDHLVAGLTQARTRTSFVHLTDVDHVLKEDASLNGDSYGKSLPYSSQLKGELRSFVAAGL